MKKGEGESVESSENDSWLYRGKLKTRGKHHSWDIGCSPN